MSDVPCACVELVDGFWMQRCDCGNSGDLANAQSWCTEQNEAGEISRLRSENARLTQAAQDHDLALEIRTSQAVEILQGKIASLTTEVETLRGLLAEARTVTADALHDSLSGGRRTYSSLLSDLLSRIDAALGDQI